MGIGGIGNAIGRFLATTPGKAVAITAGIAATGGLAFGLSKLLSGGGPSPVKDAGDGAKLLKADMVCDQGITGRQWCREANDLDYAMESSASGSESSMLSSESSTGY
jgi:hypothetical protein